MKNNRLSKFLLSILLFSFCLTGIAVPNKVGSQASDKLNKIEQFRKIQAERKHQYEIKIEAWYRARLEMLRELEQLELDGGTQFPDLFNKHASLERENQEQIDKLKAWDRAQLQKLMKSGQLAINGATEFSDPLASLELEKSRQRKEIQAWEREQLQKLRFKDPDAIDRLNKGGKGGTRAKPFNPGKLAASGAISGTVTDASAAGIQNIYIEVYDAGSNWSGSGYTDASGDYLVNGLDTGSYKVYFNSNGLNYISEWYSNKTSLDTANAVAVIDGSTTPDVDGQLATGGQISGRVRDASSVAIQNIYVSVRDSANNYVGTGYTDASGDYTVSGLPTDSYRVYFSNNGLNYISEWYSSKTSFDTADAVAVTAGSTHANVNAVLVTGGQITGNVRDVSAVGIQNIRVNIRDSGNNTVSSDYTDASGDYSVSGLPTGSYKVYFSNNGLNYLSEWYSNQTSFDTANAVAVTAGSTHANVNAVLASGGQITGNVRDVSAVGIQNIYVSLRNSSNNTIGSDYTDASGDYTVSGLPTGSYKVYFSNNGLNYISEWYSSKTSFDTADAVAVTAGGSVPIINAVLEIGGQISGTVTDASAAGIQNIYVSIRDSGDDTVGSDYTDASGNYTVSGLTTGSYKVYFSNNGLNYISEWYSNQTSFDTANAVAVTAGSTSASINAQLATGGQISGNVRDVSAVGIQNIYVSIRDSANNYVGTDYTDVSGNYSVSALTTGSYKVYFGNNGLNYISEWYSSKTSFDTADAVAVTAGSTHANVNAVLVTGGQISGNVRDVSAVGIENIYVSVLDSGANSVGSDYTDASGNYTVSGLLTGSYKVYFSNNGLNYISEWYSSKTSFDTADAVAVTAGSTHANVNVVLAAGGQITGNVRDVLDAGIQNIRVNIRDSGNNTVGSDYTDASGNYSVDGLPTGSYKVYFRNNELNYISEWYNNQTSFNTANAVSVTAGSTHANVNAVLASGGQISGTVTDISAVGIKNIYISVYDLDYDSIGSGYTDTNGNYLIKGLTSDNYKVSFNNNGLNYLSEWYTNQTSFYTADPVAVTAGSTTANINAQLAIGGQISGKVTDASAAGIQSIYVSIYDLSDNWVHSDYTDASGNYFVNSLPSGYYKVYFDNNGLNYISEWYNDKTSFNTANAVSATAGSTHANINAVLATGGLISGKVTDVSAVGIDDIEVIVYDLDGDSLVYAYTDSSGNYTAKGLPSGSCKVYFDNGGQNYIEEYYNNQTSFDTANAVAVTAGGTTPDINAQLATGGQVSGKVTNASAVGVEDIYVAVYDSGNNYIGYDYTDASGNYYVKGLPTGSHKIQFYDYDHIYQYEWYNNKTDFATADPVTVTAGNTTPNINAQLGFAVKSITVSTPNGGEIWSVASLHNITWYSYGSIASVNIDYSTDNGSSWNPVVTNTANDESFAWSVANAPSTTCLVRVRNYADGTIKDTSNAVFTILASGVETVSTPNTPTGPASGMTSTSYLFTTSGSITSMGNSVQYKFDWDDGTGSGWLAAGTITASHTWSAAGTYNVRAMARCATHTTVESLWSSTLPVFIFAGAASGAFNSPAQYKVLPEAIWSAASGGGTWMSDAQVTDVTGGSQVYVFYNTAAGRRGPFLLWDNSAGGVLSSRKYTNLLQTIDELDSGSFSYYGTLGAVEFITQDGSHLVQAAARTRAGNFSKTISALSLHNANTAAAGRTMIIPNLTNNASYRSSCGFFNPSDFDVTLELKLRNAANAQVGSTISKTLGGHGFTAFSPFTEAGIPYPGTSSDNIIMSVKVAAGVGKVVCFGASANYTSNDPAAHMAVQNDSTYDNGPGSLQILPEAIWAAATGGGTWMSDVQVVDMTGGSTVSVTFYYGGGSQRGPFVLCSGGVAGAKQKYANLLQTIDGLDSESFTYYGKVGTVKFTTQDSAHFIQVTARTLNGNYSKTFPGLNLVDAETADTSRTMLIQNYTSSSAYRSTCGFFNPTANTVTVEFTLLGGSSVQIGSQFSKTFAGYDFKSFNLFTEAGVPYPGNSYDNVILQVRPTSGTGKVVCFGASVNNTSNDPASHLAVQEE